MRARFFRRINENVLCASRFIGIDDNVLLAGFGIEHYVFNGYRYVGTRFFVRVYELSEIDVTDNVAVGHNNVIFLASFNEVQAVDKTRKSCREAEP